MRCNPGPPDDLPIRATDLAHAIQDDEVSRTDLLDAVSEDGVAALHREWHVVDVDAGKEPIGIPHVCRNQRLEHPLFINRLG